ncbi:hypothetical protein PFX98_11015 [Paucibacter sediminis]|uniref:Uncharacterized protein n=1 Tax=Paucibacter sediminis TaxID=3019553 RepID=A0AA95NHE4_9BURK|nr:hypothetical protein [Paucibacter sp. S2-9]WIT14125.1 hypothetical protein PFX98_11015 [Paucibacter sp. S2-9]
MNNAPLVIVLLTGSYFVGLAVLAVMAPAKARRFLSGFAGSALAHYAELSPRLVAGGAFVLQAPYLLLTDAFSLFGWALVGTTACLLVLPWGWHRRFAQMAVPRALERLGWIAVASFALGCLVLSCAALGPTGAPA